MMETDQAVETPVDAPNDVPEDVPDDVPDDVPAEDPAEEREERVLVAQDGYGGHSVEGPEDGEDRERHRGQRLHRVSPRLVREPRGRAEELLQRHNPALIVADAVEDILEIVDWVT